VDRLLPRWPSISRRWQMRFPPLVGPMAISIFFGSIPFDGRAIFA